MFKGFTFDELEKMKRDLVECLDEARSINDQQWEADIEEKLNALFDAELDVMPEPYGDDSYLFSF